MDSETAKDKCMLALDYVMGNKVPRDPTYAARLFEEVASEGYPNGQFGLAELLVAGNGVSRDIPRAMELYRMSAAQDHPASMFRLASFLMEEGPDRDLDSAREYMIRCADAGMTMAYIVLGDIYFYGMGVEQDMQTAYGWYRRSAAEGDPAAMFKCGYMSENGIGTRIDVPASIGMFRQAALRGVPEAAFQMANLAYCGKIPGGRAECISWYEKCAELGYPAASFNMATMYLEGDGVEKDPAKAFELYKIVADETNDADALFILGRMYLEGDGVEKDLAKAFEFIGRAADAGDEIAMQLIQNLRRRQNTQLINIDDIR